jgi:hypothetical protein
VVARWSGEVVLVLLASRGGKGRCGAGFVFFVV